MMEPPSPISSFQVLEGPSADPMDIETEPEDEIDELESDSDLTKLDYFISSSSKKSSTARTGERLPGQTLLPSSRLEAIIRAEGITGALSLSKEGLFVLSAATEDFIKRLTQSGLRRAQVANRNSINYEDMSFTTEQYQEFRFLRDTIPVSMSLSDALERRAAKAKEDLENDPALGGPTDDKASHSNASASHQSRNKSASKSKATNGPQKLNGATSHSSRTETQQPTSSWATSSTNTSATGSSHAVLDARPWNHWLQYFQIHAQTQAATKALGQMSVDPMPSTSTSQPSPVNGHPPSLSHILATSQGTLPTSTTPPTSPKATNILAEKGTEAPKDDRPPPNPPRQSRHSIASEQSSSNKSSANGLAKSAKLSNPFSASSPNPGRTIYSQQNQQSAPQAQAQPQPQPPSQPQPQPETETDLDDSVMTTTA